MRVLMSCGLTLAMFAAVGGEFTWTGGGTAGSWNSPRNWGVENGFPDAGDTAIFPDGSNVTIDQDFEIGEGVLTIELTESAVLTVDAAISGAGGITRNGKGRLNLKKANPFKGPFQSNGSATTLSSNVDYGPVYIYDGGALGQMSANFDNGINQSCARLYIDCGNGTLTIPIPVTLSRMGTKQWANLYIQNGSVIFADDVNFPSRAVIDGNDMVSEIRFKKKISVPSNYFQDSLSSSATIVFENGLDKCNSFYSYKSKATYRFAGPVTQTKNFAIAAVKVVCDVADVFAKNTMTDFGFMDDAVTVNARVDLNGFDQSYPVLSTAAELTKPQAGSFGFTSPEGKPAQVVLSGAYKNNLAYNGGFFGTAGFKWNPNTNNVLAIKSVSHVTKGVLTVANGTVVLTDGATFTALGKLEVADGATFDVAADAGSGFFAFEIEAVDGAKLRLPTGVTLHCKKFSDGKALYTAPQTFDATTHPDLFVGAGRVVIDAMPCTWTGAAGGLWSDKANWDIGEVPGEDNDVVIPSGKSVVVDATTALVNSLSIGGGESVATLAMTNWEACLNAKSVEIRKNGILTCGAAFTDESLKTRVNVSCGDFRVAAGGKIDVSAKGWSGSLYTNTNKVKPGFGPGCGTARVGASHGGYGAVDTLSVARSQPYGSAEEPVTAGSGGGKNGIWGTTNNGGGVVRIVATGAVIVDGEVQADGMGVASSSFTSSHDTAGAGGSVWITCKSLSGSGTIRADGGHGDVAALPFLFLSGTSTTDRNNGRAGGGGRIAIDYNAAAQATVEPSLKISAAAGMNSYNEKDVKTTLATSDKYHTEAEPGTLHFTDTTLFYQLLGKGLSGRMLGVSSVKVDGDLDYTYGHLRFPVEGFTFEVTGNLAVSGEDARLEVGGVCISNRVAFTSVWAGRDLNTLKVGGDLTVSNGAAVDIRAAETNGMMRWGGEVNVAGKMVVGSGGYFYAWCDPRNLGAAHFTVGSLEVEEGGILSAENRGGAGGWSAETYSPNVVDKGTHPSGFGIGVAASGAAGSSHGGIGGKTCANPGDEVPTFGGTPSAATESDFYEPVLAGAGGRCSGYDMSGTGGGIIHVEARGAIVVNGKVSASVSVTGPHSSQTTQQFCGGGAGGTIYLFGDTFESGATAEISARGGDSWATKTFSSCGGGGCIAVWTGRTNMTDAYVHRGQKKRAAVDTLPIDLGYLGTWDVDGGTNRVPFTTCADYLPYEGKDDLDETHGAVGTIRFMNIAPMGGVMIIIR